MSTPTKSLDEYKDEFLYFIRHFDISSGDKLVSIDKLYSLHRAWTKVSIPKSMFPVILQYFFKVEAGKALVNTYNDTINDLIVQSLEEKLSEKLAKFNTPKHYQGFLKFHSISKGKQGVPGQVLLTIYRDWISKETTTSAMNESTFIELCKLHFTHKPSVKHGLLFFINRKSLTTSKNINEKDKQQKQDKTRSAQS